MATGSSVAAPDRTLVTTRIFDAPRELVYRAWTDAKQLAKWFPPEGFSSPRCEVDPRPGGVRLEPTVGHGLIRTAPDCIAPYRSSPDVPVPPTGPPPS